MSDFREHDGKYGRFLATETDVPEPCADLERQVMRRIKSYKHRVFIIKTTGFGIVLVASGAGVVVGYLNLTSAFSQSGFFQFVSLFFSDFGAAMGNFQDYLFSILESFPVFSAAFLLTGIIAVIWSLAHFVEDVSQIRATRGELALG